MDRTSTKGPEELDVEREQMVIALGRPDGTERRLLVRHEGRDLDVTTHLQHGAPCGPLAEAVSERPRR